MTGNKKTILITGINGFLGSHLAKRLQTNYEVVGIEVNKKNLFRLRDEKFNVYETNPQQLDKLFSQHKIEYIIHAATLYRTNINNKSEFVSNNILYPIQLLEIALKNGLIAFINTDSFFNTDKYQYSYLSDYILSKRHFIEWLSFYKNQVKIVNMKVFHMYGPSDSQNKFVTKLLNDLLYKDHIELTLGEQKRDFIFIDDVVNAFHLVCNNLEKFDSRVTFFEVGNGTSITIKEIVDIAAKLARSKAKLLFGALEYRKGEIMNSIADNQKLFELGWKPKTTLEEGLALTIKNIEFETNI